MADGEPPDPGGGPLFLRPSASLTDLEEFETRQAIESISQPSRTSSPTLARRSDSCDVSRSNLNLVRDDDHRLSDDTRRVGNGDQQHAFQGKIRSKKQKSKVKCGPSVADFTAPNSDKVGLGTHEPSATRSINSSFPESACEHRTNVSSGGSTPSISMESLDIHMYNNSFHSSRKRPAEDSESLNALERPSSKRVTTKSKGTTSSLANTAPQSSDPVPNQSPSTGTPFQEVKNNRYATHSKGSFIVYIQPSSKDNVQTIHPLVISRFLNTAFNNDLVEVKKLGPAKVSAEFRTGGMANSVVASPLLTDKNLFAFIPSFCIARFGIIRDVPVEFDMEDLRSNLESPAKMISLNRLNRRIKNAESSFNYVPSKTVLIKFDGQFLPPHVYIFKIKFEISPYIPRTILCYSCYRFGHTIKNCKGRARCGHCGNYKHPEPEVCPNKDSPPTCINCKGAHHPTHGSCPQYIKQRHIQALAATQNIPLAEARARIQGALPGVSAGSSPVFDYNNFPSIQNNSSFSQFHSGSGSNPNQANSAASWSAKLLSLFSSGSKASSRGPSYAEMVASSGTSTGHSLSSLRSDSHHSSSQSKFSDPPYRDPGGRGRRGVDPGTSVADRSSFVGHGGSSPPGDLFINPNGRTPAGGPAGVALGPTRSSGASGSDGRSGFAGECIGSDGGFSRGASRDVHVRETNPMLTAFLKLISDAISSFCDGLRPLLHAFGLGSILDRFLSIVDAFLSSLMAL